MESINKLDEIIKIQENMYDKIVNCIASNTLFKYVYKNRNNLKIEEKDVIKGLSNNLTEQIKNISYTSIEKISAECSINNTDYREFYKEANIIDFSKLSSYALYEPICENEKELTFDEIKAELKEQVKQVITSTKIEDMAFYARYHAIYIPEMYDTFTEVLEGLRNSHASKEENSYTFSLIYDDDKVNMCDEQVEEILTELTNEVYNELYNPEKNTYDEEVKLPDYTFKQYKEDLGIFKPIKNHKIKNKSKANKAIGNVYSGHKHNKKAKDNIRENSFAKSMSYINTITLDDKYSNYEEQWGTWQTLQNHFIKMVKYGYDF